MSSPSPTDLRVVLGIGNPGPEYAATRHNVGFEILNRLAAGAGLSWDHRRFHAHCATWATAPGGRVLLLKPQTYVNCSGQSAQAALTFYHARPAQLLVVVDDIHLPLGALRFRAEGSAGGHNGLKDIIARLGQGFPRLRVGIGAPPEGRDQIAHVLGRFSDDERPVVTAAVERAAACVRSWLLGGASAAQAYNGLASAVAG